MQSLSPRQQLVLTRTHQASLLRREKGQRRHQRSALVAQQHADQHFADQRLRTLETELETLLCRQREIRSKRKSHSPLKPAIGRFRQRLLERNEFLQSLRDSLGERTASPRVYKEKPRTELVVLAGEIMRMHILGQGESFTAVSQQMAASRSRGLNLSLPEEAVLEALEPINIAEMQPLSAKTMKMELKPVESDFKANPVLLKPVDVGKPAENREKPTEKSPSTAFPLHFSPNTKARKTLSLLSKSQKDSSSGPKSQVSHSISATESLHSDQPFALPESTRSQGLQGRMGRYYKERVKPDFSPKELRPFFPWLPDSAQEAELRRKLSTLQRIHLQELPSPCSK